MNEAICNQWKSQVTDKDTVYVLGDVSVNKRYAFEYIPTLPGKKILIAGNHDDCFKFDTKESGERKKAKYLDNGWDEVYMEYNTRIQGYYVKMTHLPPLTGVTKDIDTRYTQNRPPFNPDTIHLHGHQHNRYIKNGNLIDVGFDGSLRLLSEYDIMDLIKDEKDFIPSRVTEFYNNKEVLHD
jgi:calcineurin-like phosphoesterase family protein